MKKQPSKEQQLVVLFFLFFALLQFPLLSIFNQPVGLRQWPVLFVFILLIWLALIVSVYWVIEGNPFKSRSEK
jgi:hypothetical protein